MGEANNNEPLLASDASKRGLPQTPFKIICVCGMQREFLFTKETWDVFPCPYCKAYGITNKEIAI